MSKKPNRLTAIEDKPAATVTLTLSPQGRLRRYALLSGMGLSIAVPAVFPVAASAAPFGSPGWFAQQNAGAAGTAAGRPAGASGVPIGVVTPQQAQQRAQQSMVDLSRAAAALVAAQQAQGAAQQLAVQAATNVPDGFGDGTGLQPDASAPWQNAAVNTAKTNVIGSDGKTQVTIDQSQQKAVLNWQQFNVGKNTELNFDQSKGNQADGSNNWTALNLVNASASPSQILGSINAQGSVYIINPNGIIFGGGSQVNVHSLIASTLTPSFAADFQNQGIGGATTFALDPSAPSAATASIQVQSGAKIITGDLGYSLLVAPQVSNAGTISATDGQAALVAATQLSISQTSGGTASPQIGLPLVNTSPASAAPTTVTNSGLIQSLRGNVTLLGSNAVQSGVVEATTSVTRAGSIDITAEDGGDTSGGHGSRYGAVVLAPGSVTAILPDQDGETTTSSAAAQQTFQQVAALSAVNLTGASVTFQNGSLTEAPGSNVAANIVQSQSSAIPAAPDVASYGRIYVDDGATIDVAGLADIELPISATLVTIPRLGQNELADSPLQRNGVLSGASITVDANASGTRSDGLDWQGTPVANVSGYIDQVPRDIRQLLVNGGSINFDGQEVITRSGSLLNLDGGYVHYQGGYVGTTRLLGADGRIYNIADADPNVQYLGIAGQFTVNQPRWNLTTTYVDPLLSGATQYQSDYIQGGSAGTLNIKLQSQSQYSPNPTQSAVLNGSMTAEAFAGRYQTASAAKVPSGGTFDIGADTTAGSGAAPSFVVQQHVADVVQLASAACDPSGSDCTVFNADSPLAVAAAAGDPATTSSIAYWTPVSGDDLASAGFSRVNIDARASQDLSAYRYLPDGQIQVDSALSVRPGGSISLRGARVEVNANLTAASGTIAIEATGDTRVAAPPPGQPTRPPTFAPGSSGDITIAPDVVLSTRGLWVNDTGLTADQQTGGAYIDGGTIALTTDTNVVQVDTAGTTKETTGSIDLGLGSMLDVSSGGRVLPNGKVASGNGEPLGQGGSISLTVYGQRPAYGIQNLAAGQYLSQGQIELAPGDSLRNHLLAYGFSGGGTLSLQTQGFQIGGDVSAANPQFLWLPDNFFDGQGFGSYSLVSELGSTISGDVTVRQSNLIPDYAALRLAPTGSDIYGTAAAGVPYTRLGTLDDFHRQATDFSLRAGSAFSDSATNGATVPLAGIQTNTEAFFDYFDSSVTGDGSLPGELRLDDGATLAADPGASVLLGSKTQLTVLGSIAAPGGSITLTADSKNPATSAGYAPLPQPLIAELGGVQQPQFTGAGKSVWLGADSTLDVSGTVLTDPLQKPVLSNGRMVVPTSGKVLDGGTVTISDDTGYVIAQSGARIDASGTSGTLDVAQESSSGIGPLRYQSTDVWSNGGTVTLGASNGLLFDGTIDAHGGEPGTSEGGTLNVTALDYNPAPNSQPLPSSVVVRQQGAYAGCSGLGCSVPAALTAGQDPTSVDPSLTPDTLYFAVDVLDGSGIASLSLGSRAGAVDHVVPGTLSFDGNVDLKLQRSLSIDANIACGAAAGSSCGDVTMAAPYIQVAGFYSDNQRTLAIPTGSANADANLDFEAGTLLDVGGRVSIAGYGLTTFSSGGDLRLYTPAAYDYLSATPYAGELYTGGDLTLSAAQIYPATANSFAIEAGGDSTITIQGKGSGGATPLSAGGALLIDAAHIVQSGTLRVPSGTLLLGVGDTTAADYGSLFYGLDLPLVTTQDVTLTKGSVTSVALDGAVVPYGTTLDGQNWNYNGDPIVGQQTANLSAPPAKLIAINAAGVNLNAANPAAAQAPDAVVDVSGGGKLQAQEWVPGTGGSRNVLLQYGTTGNGVQVAQYQDARAVYAIVPGYAGPAPYDPMLADGQAQPAVGQSVWLSGAPGLPAGYYTLLPGQYATLPGAYRLVQDTSTQDIAASQNAVLPDGTLRVAGHFADSLSGAQDARSTSFLIQSGAVWQQYSQFTLSDADAVFAQQAQQAGTVTPQLPMDAGHLILAATQNLALDGVDLQGKGASGGAGAEVDIAAQDVQVVGDPAQALPGYMTVNAADLDALGASSLLIGGSRTRTSAGDQLTVLANSVVVSTDAASPLRAPELILATKTDAGSSDPLAANGLRVDDGSVIVADGAVSPGNEVPIVIGADANGSSAAVDGGGALLRVSNGSAVSIVRNGVSSDAAQAHLDIGAGAQIGSTDTAAVSLDTTGSLSLDPNAVLAARSIDATGDAVSFVADGASGGSGLVLGSQTLAQLANTQQLTLRSRGSIDFVGNVDVSLDNTNLALSAGTFRGTGGDVVLDAATLKLFNDLDAAPPAFAAGTGSLTLKAGEIDFGAADNGALPTLSGFGSVVATATQAIVGEGSGGFDFGTLPVTFNTPVMLAGTAADTELKTSGTFTVNGTGDASQAQPPSSMGGKLALQGGALSVDTRLQATAGKVSLEASSGDLTLGNDAVVSVQGTSKAFFDVTRFASAGAIDLTADAGSVQIASGAVLDFAADKQGGDAGSLSISATSGNVQLDGTLQGQAANGKGGSFSLDSGGGADLDTLTAALTSGGVDQQVRVHTRSGNLTLSQDGTLRAASVQLIADGGSGGYGGYGDTTDGNVNVFGTIDASGTAGGSIVLYGRSGVDVEGRLLATASDASQRGGSVTLGTSGTGSGAESALGYESISAAQSGRILIGTQPLSADAAPAVIDVSNTAAGASAMGGTLLLRAPLLDDGSVNVSVASGQHGAQLLGARSKTLEADATWLATGTAGPIHFDGIIDPAGIYTAQGTLVAGTFTDADGNVVANGTLDSDYFTAAAGAVNTDHQAFYQTTLVNFVQNPGFTFANTPGLSQFQATPGIELVNGNTAVNNGDITVASNWNLGAGSQNLDGSLSLIYRYQRNTAPILTLRAVNDLNIDASLSDGFFETANPFQPQSLFANLDNSASPVATAQNPLPLLSSNLDGSARVAGLETAPVNSSSYRLVAGSDVGSVDPMALDATAVRNGSGDVVLDHHTSGSYGLPSLGGRITLYAPTMVRTGTGSIAVSAAHDVQLADSLAPGVIYAAGYAQSGRTGGALTTYVLTPYVMCAASNGGTACTDPATDIGYDFPGYVITGAVNPVDAGDVSIAAGNDISGRENFSSLWSPWMQLGNPGELSMWLTGSAGGLQSSSINFGAFDQGIMSVGGNVAVTAGGNITDLSVSLPTTWNLASSASGAPIGSGSLNVAAGGDLRSGSYFVSNGSADIKVGGAVLSDLSTTVENQGAAAEVPLSTLFALQNGTQMQVDARLGIDAAGVLNPSYYDNLSGNGSAAPLDSQSYTAQSAFSASSLTGDVLFDSLPQSLSYAKSGMVDILPSTVALTALEGAISVQKRGELFPSQNGELSLIADGNIALQDLQAYGFGGAPQSAGLGLIDAAASALPSPVNQLLDAKTLMGAGFLTSDDLSGIFTALYYQLHTADPLHAQDAQPVLVYSLHGDIVDGVLNGAGEPVHVLTLDVGKTAAVRAGRDIVNLSFLGQNLYGSDITSIVAGRDLYDTPYPPDPSFETGIDASPTVLQLDGPGTFVVAAGRNLGPFTSANQQNKAYNEGILSVGNLYNPYLSRSGADIEALFGVGPGMDLAGFEARYIDPASSSAGLPSFTAQLVDFVQKYDEDQMRRADPKQTDPSVTLTAAQAWTQFQALPQQQQARFVYSVYFEILNAAGLDYNDATSPYYKKYTLGYQAIETLFPYSLGYTRNNPGSGINGALTSVDSGNLDMRGSTIQTQQGGDISVVGPGGEILVGSTAALLYTIDPSRTPPTVPIAPNLQGILTLAQGDINIFSDRSVLLAQSRIFTEEGGNLLIWSSNGDINAGKGAKTTTELPQAQFLCDPDHFCYVDGTGQVSGAGIATLQTVPDAPLGSVNLIAPAGTVDAGDAGIRVSGNINIAAQHVANATNIQVQGQSAGVPTGRVDTGALSAASQASAAANQAAQDMASSKPVANAATMITVEVVGYGSPDEQEKRRLRHDGT